VATVRTAHGYSARKHIGWQLYVPLMATVLGNTSRGYCTCRSWLQCSETYRVAIVRATNGYSVRKYNAWLQYVPLITIVFGNISRGYSTYH
jgi:hypothetical protein